MVLQKLRKNKKGFTLVELIVVLVVLAILIGALTPTMIGFINEARGKALVAEARVGLLAAQMVVVESPDAAADTAWRGTPGNTALTGATRLAWVKKFNALTVDITGIDATATFTNVTIDGSGPNQGHVTGITYTRAGYTVTIVGDGSVTVVKN